MDLKEAMTFCEEQHIVERKSNYSDRNLHDLDHTTIIWSAVQSPYDLNNPIYDVRHSLQERSRKDSKLLAAVNEVLFEERLF